MLIFRDGKFTTLTIVKYDSDINKFIQLVFQQIRYLGSLPK